MSDCPRCFHELDENRSDGGVSWQCPDCGGLLATLPFLRRRLSVEAANRIWQTARETEPGSSSRECPFCGKDMVRVQAEFDGREVELDACLPCQAFWFDRGEVEALPAAPPPPPPEPSPELSEEAREKLAVAQMELIREMADSAGPDHDGQTSGLPSSAAFPWATLLIIVLSTAVWIVQPRTWGSHESYWEAERIYWILLIAMVWQLWNFGRAAEQELGGGRLLELWGTGGAAAGIVLFVATREPIPLLLTADAFLAILVWLALQFPWAQVASSMNRGRFGPLVRFWVPLSFHAAIWGVLCVFLPFLLREQGSGSLVATLAAAAVGVAFHFAGRRRSSRRA